MTSPRSPATVPWATAKVLLMATSTTPWSSQRPAQAFVPHIPYFRSDGRRPYQGTTTCTSKTLSQWGVTRRTGEAANRPWDSAVLLRDARRSTTPRCKGDSCYGDGYSGYPARSSNTRLFGSIWGSWGWYRNDVNSACLGRPVANKKSSLRATTPLRAVPPSDSAPGEGPGDIPTPGMDASPPNGASVSDEDKRRKELNQKLGIGNAEESSNYTPDPFAKDDEDEGWGDTEEYEEIVANMTKPLGITIEASSDKAALVYITSVGEQAEDAGLEIGDVVTGVSGVFGNDVWSVKGKGVEKIRSMVRCRTEPYILVRVERGHLSLEERCVEGFGVVSDEDGVAFCSVEDDDEDDDEFADIWGEVYRDEMEVMERQQSDTSGEAGIRGGAGRGSTKPTQRTAEALDFPGNKPYPDSNWGGTSY